jgi:hypothetical protein
MDEIQVQTAKVCILRLKGIRSGAKRGMVAVSLVWCTRGLFPCGIVVAWMLWGWREAEINKVCAWWEERNVVTKWGVGVMRIVNRQVPYGVLARVSSVYCVWVEWGDGRRERKQQIKKRKRGIKSMRDWWTTALTRAAALIQAYVNLVSY